MCVKILPEFINKGHTYTRTHLHTRYTNLAVSLSHKNSYHLPVSFRPVCLLIPMRINKLQCIKISMHTSVYSPGYHMLYNALSDMFGIYKACHHAALRQ